MAEITYREALQQAMRDEMRRDENVLVMGEEIGRVTITPSKVTEGLFQEFGPKRVRDTPIAEEGFVGAAIGAAMLGLRPVVEIMTLNFILVAMDQIINHAAKIRYMFGGEVKVPLVIRAPGGGGGQLTAQHSQGFDLWFASTPGLKVLAPATPADAKGLLKSAIRDDDPVLFLESLPLYATRGEVPEGDYTTPIGVANVLREGTDLTVVSHSFATVRAMRLANRLAQEGVEVEVVDLDAPVERVGGAEVPMPYARPLERAALVNDEKIYQAAQELLRESGMLSRGVGAAPGSASVSPP